jgi:hypothetical protein
MRRPPDSDVSTLGGFRGHAAPAGADDPLAELARMVADDPDGDDDRNFAAHGAAAGDDAPYPPEAYAGIPYDGEDHDATVPRSRRGGLMAAVAVAAVVVLGGGAVLAFRGAGGSAGQVAGGAPPVITASAAPTKIVPKPEKAEKGTQNKLIYDRVNADSASNAHVVGGAEEPMQRPSSVDVGPADAATPPMLKGAQLAATSKEVATGDGSRQVTTITIKPEGGMKVPTDTLPLATENPTAPGAPAVPVVSVRPAEVNGTAVDAAPGPAATASVAEPSQPRGPVVGTGAAAGLTFVPGRQFGIMEGGGQSAQDKAGSVPVPPPAPTQTAAASSAGESAAPAQPAAPVPLPEARPQGLQLAAAEPSPTRAAPARAEHRAVGAPVRLSPLALASAGPAAAQQAAGGGYMVQLTSQRTLPEATDSFHALQKRYPELLGSYSAAIQPAPVSGHTYYRVRVGAFSLAQADGLCKQIKARGGSCIVQRQ